MQDHLWITQVLLDFRVEEGQARPVPDPQVPAKKIFSSLRPPPTARSRRQSRGLHPVGALSVPPLEWYPLGMVRPVRVMAKQQKKTCSRREEILSNQLLDVGPAPNHTKKIL